MCQLNELSEGCIYVRLLFRRETVTAFHKGNIKVLLGLSAYENLPVLLVQVSLVVNTAN